MSLLFSLMMKMDAGQAKAELRALQGEVTKGKTEVTGLGNAAAVADDKIDGLGAASARAAAKNDHLSTSSRGVSVAAQSASGSMGNLVAQFNDIGMMMAAGQNPLMLAVQQGTQITQVIGPMGAAGAARALGGAFMALFQPINLVTLGAIALGTAAVQWLFDSGEAAKSFAESIDDVGGAITDLQKAGQRDLAALKGDFGTVTADVIEMETALGRLATVKAFKVQHDALTALKSETAGSWFGAFTEDRFTQGGQIADILGTDWLVNGKLVATDAVSEFRAKLESLDTAKGPRAQLEIFRSLQQQMLQTTGGIDQMTTRQMGFYEALVVSEQQARQLLQAQTEAAAAANEAARAAGSDDGRGSQARTGLTADDLQARIDASATAQELLATLQEQASVQDLITQYGRDSANVALARVEAERDAFAQMVDGLEVAEGLKLEIMGAWDAANGLASARIAAAIEAALGPASALAGYLKSAAGWLGQLRAGVSLNTFKAGGLASQYASYGQGRVQGEQAVRGESALYGGDGNILTKDLSPPRLGSGSGAGRGGAGGGANAAREERDAVAELIQKLREEQEVLKETDPVKQEMLKYRKQLAEASVAERTEVEALIQAEMHLKAIHQAREYASDGVGDLLDQIIAKGGKAGDVLRNLATQFLSMAARSVVSGQGWVAGLLGISGGLFGGAQAKADGGMIFGEGGPRDDKVPLWASPGEFMVNARAAGRHRALLERINAGGAVRGFADGGMIGGGSTPSSSGATQAPEITVNIHGATGNEEVRRTVADGIKAALVHYDRHMLPERVAAISRRPRDR